MTGPAKRKTGGMYARQALLPIGFRDQIGEAAERDAAVVAQLIGHYLRFGYDRVSPPIVEFEDSLLTGPGAEHGAKMFRLMDAETQRMMGVRTDITVQLSRLATTRLADAPRPLRMAYSGNVLRTKGTQIRPTRQFSQVGVELIGADSLEAELEVISLAVTGLQGLGIDKLSLDLTVAPVIRHILQALNLSGDAAATVIDALDTKDVGTVMSLGGDARDIFATLLSASGPADEALDILTSLALDGEAGRILAHLAELAGAIKKRMPDLMLTIDPCESRGFEYKTGVGFAVFAAASSSELGRGGQYCVTHPDGTLEAATGFSVYLDSLASVLPPHERAHRIFVAHGTPMGEIERLQENGFRTVQGLTDVDDERKEARLLGCSHVLLAGKAEAV